MDLHINRSIKQNRVSLIIQNVFTYQQIVEDIII